MVALFVARDTALGALETAKLAVNVSGGSIQLATKVLAAGAEGKIVSIQSARLRGKVAAYDAGGKVELEANVRLLDEPKAVRVSLSPGQLQSGEVFQVVARALMPKS